MVALALRPATPLRYRRARLRAVAARRVGIMRKRWPRRRRSRRVAPCIAVQVGEAPHPGPLFTKHLACPHGNLTAVLCGNISSASTCLRRRLSVLSERSFTEADAVDEGRRRRQRGVHSQEARQRRLGRGEPCTIGREEFTILHSNVRGSFHGWGATASSAYHDKPTKSSHLAPQVHLRNPGILHNF